MVLAREGFSMLEMGLIECLSAVEYCWIEVEVNGCTVSGMRGR
jgi:hypothetical protein